MRFSDGGWEKESSGPELKKKSEGPLPETRGYQMCCVNQEFEVWIFQPLTKKERDN